MGLEVYTDSSGIILHQYKYTQDLHNLAGLQDASSVDTLLEVNTKYRHEEGNFISNPTIFRQLVGSLNYLTITRPDISFVVQQVSQFMQNPRHLHLDAVIESFDIFVGHLVVACSFQLVLLLTLLPIVMLIGLDVLILADLSRVGACFLVIP